MKNLKHLLFSGLALMLVFSSCTMEKRLYSSGYHIEWNKSRQNPDRQKLVNKDKDKKIEQNEIRTVEQVSNTIDNTTTIKDEIITASANDKQIILPQKKKINLYSSHKVKAVNEEEQVKPTFKSLLKKEIKTPLLNGDEPKFNEAAIAGFILSIVGIGLILMGGWGFLYGLWALFVLGTLGTLLGIIFSIIGLTEIGKTEERGRGFALMGLIIGLQMLGIILIILGLVLLI